MSTALPLVTVVVPTHDRPALLREAVGSVLGQDYAGPIEVIVVHDRSEPDHSLANSAVPDRRVRVLANARRPGLAGARNTGILAAAGELVAFLDDDDAWLQGKLRAQVDLLRSDRACELVSCGIVVDFDGTTTARTVGRDRVTYPEFLQSRMAMVHSSTLLFRTEALRGPGGLGLVDEDIPSAQNEDWDLLIRAAARHDVRIVDHPLVRVRWGRTSYFARRWDAKADGLLWMLGRHPDIGRSRRGAARVDAQIAFARACAGHHREGATWAWRATRLRPLEWRSAATALVLTRLVTGEQVLAVLHRFGRGV